MLAYDPAVPVAYNIDLTVMSLLAATIITGLGMAAAVFVPGRWGALVGGGIIGIGVACMHYLGMSALELPGHVAWDLPLVVASIVVGIALAMAALVVAVQWRGRTPGCGSRRCCSRLPSCRITSRPWGPWISFRIRRAP